MRSKTRTWILLLPLVPAGGTLLLLGAGLGAPTAPVASSGSRRGSSPKAQVASLEPGAHDTSEPVTGASGDAGRSSAKNSDKASSATPSPVASLLVALRRAHDQEDDAGVSAARARVRELARKDPHGTLKELLVALRASADEAQLGLVLGLITSDPSLARDEVRGALLELAQHDELPLYRAAALHGLGQLRSPDETQLADVAACARQDPDSTVREAAATALGQIGDRSPGALAASSARAIAASLPDEQDARVRATLVYAVRDTREAPVADALVSSLADQDLQVRLAAADMLGDVAASHRADAVTALSSAFARETQPDVRLTLVTAIVRAGRMNAIGALEGLSGGDLQPVIDDYLAGLRSGEDNPEKLFALRQARERARKGS